MKIIADFPMLHFNDWIKADNWYLFWCKQYKDAGFFRINSVLAYCFKMVFSIYVSNKIIMKQCKFIFTKQNACYFL